MAKLTAELRVHVRRRRFEQLKAKAIADIKRAPKRERAAMLQRIARQTAELCVVIELDTDGRPH